jgi:L-alanine-DL-glutamate epimerase-like enolase superfamily enzyme
MKRTIEIIHVQVPFREKFTHSNASREETETIVVKILNEKGQTGLGESCPRSYVTGETIDSCEEFIQSVSSAILSMTTLQELKSYIDSNAQVIDKNPAAFCAIELAMLDILAQEKNITVEKLLSLKTGKQNLKYTAVLGIDSWPGLIKKILVYASLGFEDYKIKISGDAQKDLKKIKIISIFSKRIRVDGNNIFKNATEAIDYLTVIRPYIWAVEEPLQPSDFEGMKKIVKDLHLVIILDESFKSIDDILRLQGKLEYFIPNVRISKMGGLLRTLSLITELEKHRGKFILGSHVGEMSLLTKAALLISEHSQKILAKEGGFGTWLLKEDYFHPNYKLTSGAQLKKVIEKEKKESDQTPKVETGMGMRFKK